MDINEIKRSYEECARGLGEYNLLSKTELANGYCDAEEAMWLAQEAKDIGAEVKYSQLRDQYMSAILLRYWYKIFKWAEDSVSLHLDYVDFLEWLIDSIFRMGAFYYKEWRYEWKAIVKEGRFIDWKYDDNGNRIENPYYYLRDINAPDKIINRCCLSVRGREYQYYNKDKRRAVVQKYSLDSMVEENGDSALEYSGAFSVDEPYHYGIDSLVEMFLKRDEPVEALLIHGIAFGDTFKRNKKDKEVSFSERLLLKHLHNINSCYMKEFCEHYSIDNENGYNIYQKLKDMSSSKIYRIFKKIQAEIKNDPKLRSCLQGD